MSIQRGGIYPWLQLDNDMAFKPLFGRAHACLVLMAPVIIPLLLRARNRPLLHPFNELHPKYAPRLVSPWSHRGTILPS